jgi:hypothetical protein
MSNLSLGNNRHRAFSEVDETGRLILHGAGWTF